jgi:predicted DNA-binding protein
MEAVMAFSITLDPILHMRIAQEAKRLGITESQLVQDILERALGNPNPYALLEEIRSGKPMGDPNASENVSQKVRAKLRAKHSA